MTKMTTTTTKKMKILPFKEKIRRPGPKRGQSLTMLMLTIVNNHNGEVIGEGRFGASNEFPF